MGTFQKKFQKVIKQIHKNNRFLGMHGCIPHFNLKNTAFIDEEQVYTVTFQKKPASLSLVMC